MVKKVKITQGEIPHALYKLGVNYHGVVQLKDANQQGFLGFKCDRIPNELKEKLMQIFPQVKFFLAQSQYAPEQVRGIIAFPRKTRLFMMA